MKFYLEQNFKAIVLLWFILLCVILFINNDLDKHVVITKVTLTIVIFVGSAIYAKINDFRVIHKVFIILLAAIYEALISKALIFELAGGVNMGFYAIFLYRVFVLTFSYALSYIFIEFVLQIILFLKRKVNLYSSR